LVFLPRATALHIVIASAAAVASSSSDALDIGMAVDGRVRRAMRTRARCASRTRQVGDERLEVQERLQAALRNLRLPHNVA
jgi:hypothetical protein